MKRLWIIIGALAVIAIGGIVVWMLLGARPQSSTDSTRVGDTSSTVSDVTDFTNQTNPTVTMKNTAFTPQKIKIKKGTTVKWVNEDTVRHNVIALNDNDQSGLPNTNPLLGNGESYTFTFELAGTFEYKCSPHPFMTGMVEVVD